MTAFAQSPREKAISEFVQGNLSFKEEDMAAFMKTVASNKVITFRLKDTGIISKEQVKSLFNREAFQFPPPVIDEENSCFAMKDDDSLGVGDIDAKVDAGLYEIVDLRVEAQRG